MIDTLTFLQQKRDPEASELYRRYFGYPSNLPDLAALKPPGGNSRPEGLEQSAFACRGRGELPDMY